MVKEIDAEDTVKIWQAAVQAVRSDVLVSNHLKLNSDSLSIADHQVPLSELDRVLVVGAGKAGAGMARAAAEVLRPLAQTKKVEGWINVPADCVEPNELFEIHSGRPAGVNEPTVEGVFGARKILSLVNKATRRDLVLGLFSGGGSALLPLPASGISLQAKLELTRFLSRNGATIDELNCVRAAISQIKGGGLIQDFRGHSFHSLLISDVLGNPLDVIASGPTVPKKTDFKMALQILQKFDPARAQVDSSIYRFLETSAPRHPDESQANKAPIKIMNTVIGDNATAVSAAKAAAESMGYFVETESALKSEGDVEVVANRIWQLIESILRNRSKRFPYCLVSGGEPTVTLKHQAGKGGRNQHLALLIADRILHAKLPREELARIEFLSGGTDGEDGPTDAAGASVNKQTIEQAVHRQLSAPDFLARNDSYHFFDLTKGLIKTGATHTNVCDIRVLVIR